MQIPHQALPLLQFFAYELVREPGNKACIIILPERVCMKFKPNLLMTIILLGLLQSIINLVRRNNSDTLSWIAPFSLDLTDVDPDIVYCVEVYNITCGRSLLISECNVMETSYTNDALLPGCIYEYTVTPRSNVEGVRNGKSLTTRGLL